MKLQDLQNQALQLSLSDRWHLVQLLLRSIQQETQLFKLSNSSANSFTDLDPWTQSLIGAIQLNAENFRESYVDYLEEKYN